MRRTMGRVSAVMIAVAVGIGLLAAPAAAVVKARRVVGGLNQPTAFTFAGRVIWYVEKSTGEIHTFDPATHTDHTFATISGVNSDGERGMLGIALDPAYPTRPFVYVYVTRSAAGHLRNQIVRLTDSGGTGTNLRVLWSVPASSTPYHNGGHIAFGPDRMLYAVVGEGHHPALAQKLGSDRGKVLRMTRTGSAPADNPFPHSRVYSYGLRNSFGFAFDPTTGRLWETENGPECNDELNRIIAGRNYGWGPSETCSGTSPRDTNQDGPSPVLPKLWYTPTIAPTGIAFCRHCGLGKRSRGALFFGAYNTGQIRRVRLNAKRTGVRRQTVVFTSGSGIFSMQVGPRGRLYFSDASGAIYRLVLG